VTCQTCLPTDIASISVEQARQRYESFRGPRFDATFAACDCYSVSISTVLDPGKLSTLFDVVSMQFCMHYAFETEERARCMLDNVSRWLRPGGVFAGTIPNSGQLLCGCLIIRNQSNFLTNTVVGTGLGYGTPLTIHLGTKFTISAPILQFPATTNCRSLVSVTSSGSRMP
jgi:SAM-dependent methyltransferase